MNAIIMYTQRYIFTQNETFVSNLFVIYTI